MRPSPWSRAPGRCGLLHRSLAALLGDRRGAIAPVVAAFVPVALGTAGLAIDVSNSYVEQNRLQIAVDEAALVAVEQLPDIEAARASLIQAFSKQYDLKSRDRYDEESEAIEPHDIVFGRWDPSTREVTPVEPDGPPANTVAVRVDRLAADGRGLDTWFLAALGIEQLDLRARAVALAEGGDIGTCIIALDPTAGKAVHVQGNATLMANGCRIQVNSTAGNAIQVTGGAGNIEADEICVVGGAQNSARMSPPPRTGCAPVSDPLADFTPPSIGTCDHFGFQVKGGGRGAKTLQPGVYCGGLTIRKSMTIVTLF